MDGNSVKVFRAKEDPQKRTPKRGSATTTKIAATPQPMAKGVHRTRIRSSASQGVSGVSMDVPEEHLYEKDRVALLQGRRLSEIATRKGWFRFVL